MAGYGSIDRMVPLIGSVRLRPQPMATVGAFLFPPLHNNKPTEGKPPHPYEQRVGISGNCVRPALEFLARDGFDNLCGFRRVHLRRRKKGSGRWPKEQEKGRKKNSEEKDEEKGKSSLFFSLKLRRRKNNRTQNITKLRT
jgi:hypothetical protein